MQKTDSVVRLPAQLRLVSVGVGEGGQTPDAALVDHDGRLYRLDKGVVART